ncbi:hypothetical protein ACN26Y_00305 [Micromonospora sp. WMMD558]|uniref:hypothetical protein n=1 Tax=unclassified Micromonospora TaxID=2617518 RepID=UPI0012B4D8FB|nr:hypothetical protein [Micromonospora sp. WMMC415]QGN50123.1 hypothetical protein GKC29_27100 [Micromonospora sp. WMMC415]
MTNRTLPAVAVLAIATALTAACGDDNDKASGGAWGDGSRPSAAAAASAPSGDASAPGDPAAPGATGTTERRPSSAPKAVLPSRMRAAPGAREVVAAFKAAGLKVTDAKDRSVDCGPDGLGLGCSELIATDGVTVYVFPDEVSAKEIAETWSGQSFQRGAVVLNYLEAKTPAADRPKYEKVLTDLR